MSDLIQIIIDQSELVNIGNEKIMDQSYKQSTSETNNREILQANTREAAKQYLIVQENTEYLTQVLRYSPKREKKPLVVKQKPSSLNNLKQDKNLQKGGLDLRSLYALIVQATYLGYCCLVRSLNLYLCNQIYCTKGNKNKKIVNLNQAFTEFLLQKEFYCFSQKQQTEIRQNFTFFQFSTNKAIFGIFAIKLIQRINEYIQEMKQQSMHLNEHNNFFQYFDNLWIVAQNFLMPKNKLYQEAKIVILILQTTQIFRQYSILVKIMNNSIYTLIRNSRSSNQIFKKIAQFQNKITKCKQKFVIYRQFRDVQEAIEESMKILVHKNIITVQQSLNQQKDSSGNRSRQQSKKYDLGQVEGDTLQNRRYSIKFFIHQKQFERFSAKSYNQIVKEVANPWYKIEQKQKQLSNTYQNLFQRYQEQKRVKNEYLLEYNALKNLIFVKYISNIELSIQNVDLMMYQCNGFSAHLKNVSVELSQRENRDFKKRSNKRRQRVIIFKTVCCFNLAERPILNILLLLDLVMSCAKISQPEIKTTLLQIQDYNDSIIEIGKKIDHVVDLFIKRVDATYCNLN